MAPLPKRKYANARAGKRRSHIHLTGPSLNECPQCHAVKLSHRVCPACGTYAGRTVVEIKTEKKKKAD
jgi:large subunit ribosomal protein L32